MGGLGIFLNQNSLGNYPRLLLATAYGQTNTSGNIPGNMGLGTIDFAGFSQSDGKYLLGAWIRSYATNAWSSNNASSYLDFATNQGSASPTSRMRITEAGNVLVGTTTDNGVDKLQINGSVNTTSKMVIGDELKVNGANSFVYSDRGGTAGTVRAGFFLEGISNAIHFFTNNVEVAKLSNGGNLLIGTTTDNGADKFQVSATSATTISLNYTNGANSYGGYNIYENGTNSGSITSFGSSSGVGSNRVNTLEVLARGTKDITFSTTNSIAERMRITNGGDICTNVNASPPTIPNNSMMSFQLVSNTQLKVLVKGTDGTVRSTTLTLS